MRRQSPQDLIRLFKSLKRRNAPTALAVVVVAAVALVGGFLSTGGGISAGECAVTKIYDGDTMTLQCAGQSEKTKVRMYCIDTPEMRQKPWGTKSRDYLRSIASSKVKLVQHDKDRYGRIVGEVFTLDGKNLNLAQVEAGQAAVYEAYCKKPEYSRAQKQAQAAKLGIWAEPGLQQSPWDWRKQNK
jgi:endonuclease YncB( thermonuclease family)